MKVAMYKVVKEYHKLNPQGHWFDDSTMRFFQCRLPERGYVKGDDYYFISSERYGYDPRRYTVRKLDRNNGNIETIGPFNELTKTEARRLLAQTLDWKIKDL